MKMNKKKKDLLKLVKQIALERDVFELQFERDLAIRAINLTNRLSNDKKHKLALGINEE